jgi:hypothetical protein
MFRDELTTLLNKYNLENGSNTPDWILAEYLDDCLKAFDLALQKRAKWYNSWIKNGICDTYVTHKELHGISECEDRGRLVPAVPVHSNEKIEIVEKETDMNGVRIISPVLNRQKPQVKESASPAVGDTISGQYDKAGVSNKTATKPPEQVHKKIPAVVQKKDPLRAMKKRTSISTARTKGAVKPRSI